MLKLSKQLHSVLFWNRFTFRPLCCQWSILMCSTEHPVFIANCPVLTFCVAPWNASIHSFWQGHLTRLTRSSGEIWSCSRCCHHHLSPRHHCRLIDYPGIHPNPNPLTVVAFSILSVLFKALGTSANFFQKMSMKPLMVWTLLQFSIIQLWCWRSVEIALVWVISSFQNMFSKPHNGVNNFIWDY